MRKSVVILSFALSFTGRASASQTFPPIIATRLGLVKAPDCTLCHRDDNGGKNTIDKPFGRWLLKNGLAADQDAELRALIGEMDDLGVDSDGDCVANTDELRNGTNPNVKDAHVDGGATGCVADDASSPPSLNTGCVVKPTKDSGTAGPTLAVATIVLAASLRRRRRPDRKTTP